MELLFEIIVELIAELALLDLDISSNSKLPKPIKIIVTILFVAFYIGVIAVITWAAITFLNKGKYVMFVVLLVVDICIAVGVIYSLVKKYKSMRR